jgi:hypothetical protein
MKLRMGFVSNSSSASFIIQKKNISEKQIEMIKNHYEEGYNLQKKNGETDKYVMEEYYPSDWDKWAIKEDDDTITVATSMTNFDMEGFLTDIGLKEDIDFIGGEEFLIWDWDNGEKEIKND